MNKELDAKMPEGYYKILNNDRETKIWNSAIEEAAKEIVIPENFNLETNLAIKIRKLKK